MTAGDWQPSASLSALRGRATLLQAVRDFFHARCVLEVETPVLLSHTVTDVQIESLRLAGVPRFLHTSPEYPMKRLLAAGSGDIWQLCRVFRAGERSTRHNPEFTMIEWYRLGFDLPALMAETAALADGLRVAAGLPPAAVETLSYQQAFQRELGVDPLTIPQPELRTLCITQGLDAVAADGCTRDDLLDFLVATRVGPALGRGQLTCLHHFPASQAALACLDEGDPRTAQRFELYAEGLELANGYVELANADEQRARFGADRAERSRRGRTAPEMDERLLAALAHGLPRCAGVAMGFDRVAMLALGAASIDEVLAFAWERA